MFSSKHSNAKKPTIRRETVLVPVKSNRPTPNGPSRPSSTTPRPAQASSVKPKAKPPAPEHRFKLPEKTSAKPPSLLKAQNPAQRAVSSSRGLKRKSTTPDIHFSSDDGDSSDGFGNSDSDVTSRKRIKSSVSSVESSGPHRNLVREDVFGEEVVAVDCLHGADATSGEHEAKFKNPWNDATFETVELQYPSNTSREKFQLKWPKNEKDDYKAMEDISETIKEISKFYFPDELSDKYNTQYWTSRFNRAWQQEDISAFINIVSDFNGIIKPLISDGTIRRELSLKRRLPLDTIRRILDQIYARTVSPKVESLRAYQNGGDNVYGELLPRFCSTIFEKTGITESSIFLDLGSGVGNTVLQAALEVGCESWGIEEMKNPCDLAELQAKEFPARTKLWGLPAGKINLLRGDFTNSPEINAVLQKADLVLVNNQAFTPSLNANLLNMFLDLKEGCKVVSLKPFVPDGHKITSRNFSSAANTLVQQRYEYFSDCVSWTNQFGFWYIATKDMRLLKEWERRNRAL